MHISKLAGLMSILMAIGAFSWKASASEVRFEAGDQFTIHQLEGIARVRCRDTGGYQTHIAFCNGTRTEPARTSYVLGPVNPQIDEVVLTATTDDHSSTKSVDYIGKEGRSEKAVNLLISTLTQRPLLRIGQNNVSYILRDVNDNPIATGSFDVDVSWGDKLRCPTDYIYSSFPSDCRGTSVCYEYFRRNEHLCRAE